MTFPRLCKLPEKGSCLLLGPRQTGKTTLARSVLPPDAFVVDLLQHDTFLRFAKDPSQLRREVEAKIRSGTRTVLIDEVQKIPALLDEAHGLIEAHRLRLILTGSSARKLRRGGVNLLAGRAAVRHLHPLTMREMGDAFDLDRALRFGTLPAVVGATDDEARDLLESYARTYLQEEVQAEALVRNIGGFARFLDVAAAECGDVLNVAAVSRDAGLPARTVKEYYQILEDTLLGFMLAPWRSSARARLVGHPRFYLFDTGLTNALLHRFTAPLDGGVRGRLFEQLVVLESIRLVDYLRSEATLHYWRTHHGAEVDLLFEKHGKLCLAAEIKSTPRVSGADLSGLRSFAEAHPDVRRIVISTAPEEYDLGNATVVPYRQFFDRFEEWVG